MTVGIYAGDKRCKLNTDKRNKKTYTKHMYQVSAIARYYTLQINIFGTHKTQKSCRRHGDGTFLKYVFVFVSVLVSPTSIIIGSIYRLFSGSAIIKFSNTFPSITSISVNAQEDRGAILASLQKLNIFTHQK